MTTQNLISEGRRFGGITEGAPDGCDREMAERLDQLFSAISNGAPDVGKRFFTDGDVEHFQWFSFTDRDAPGPGHFVTYSPDSIDVFVAARHAAGDRFVLRGAKLIGYDSAAGTIGFSPVLFDYHLLGEDGEPAGHFGVGKGGYKCAADKFDGMSLGATVDDRLWRVTWDALEPNIEK